jgi:hypothetical protein
VQYVLPIFGIHKWNTCTNIINTMFITSVFCLNGLYHNGQINSFCLNGLYSIVILCIKGFTCVVLVFACTTAGTLRVSITESLYLVRKHVRTTWNTDNFRQVIYTDINSTPGSKTRKPLFRACKYILSPCINKTVIQCCFWSIDQWYILGS